MRNKLSSIISASSIILVLAVILEPLQGSLAVASYSRGDFPSDFVFGAGSSAHQVEGAAFEDGRTPSILDHHPPGTNKSKWEKACDEYHKYKEDVKLIASTGLDAYKFSISWSRLIPNGKGPVNPKAVEYYNNLINELVSHGIQPHVLLLHMDTPQALEDEYGGWLSRQIVKDFKAYADVCFREFGDRVFHWTTLNEPNVVIPSAYDLGIFPPNRCSPPFGSCSTGDSTTEPYVVAHNMLLSHASVVKLYRKKYQGKQQGCIGLNIFTGWFRPETDSREDSLAVRRGIEFLIGWFLDPLTHGDYPDVMKRSVGSRLPIFTEDESKLLKNSFDFIGVNCYSSVVVQNNPSTAAMDVRDYSRDSGASSKYVEDDGTVVQHVLEFFKQAYGNPPIYIHENGYRTLHNSSLNDTSRVIYLNASIGGLLDAIRNGSNVRGYFVWSIMDMLELEGDNTWSFGLYYVDFNDVDLKRYPKLSAKWYCRFLKGVNCGINGNVLQLSNSTFVSHGLSSH